MSKWTLKNALLSIILDFTTEGERVITKKEHKITEDGRRYVHKESKVVKETGEVLAEYIYSPNNRRPIMCHVYRPYMLN